MLKNVLDANIYAMAKLKGAKIDAKRPVPKSLQESSFVVQEYQRNICWPLEKEYQSDVPNDLVSPICLGGDLEPLPKEFELSKETSKDLYWIGIAGGGDYLLLIDGSDPNPQNPTVYQMNHYTSLDDELTEICSLLDLFQSLKDK